MDDASLTARRVIVLRHASEGSRIAVRELDMERPLDEEGKRQASALAQSLLGYEPPSILSSPARRCTETVEPLAATAGLQVELRDELAIGSDAAAVRSLLQTSPDGTIVCTHREVIASLLGAEQVPAKGDASSSSSTMTAR